MNMGKRGMAGRDASTRSAPLAISGSRISLGSRLSATPSTVSALLMNRLVQVLKWSGVRLALANHAWIVSYRSDGAGCVTIGIFVSAAGVARFRVPRRLGEPTQ